MLRVLRAQYELDLYWPIRFSRWLVGEPTGPIIFAGQQWFVNVAIGCYFATEGGGCSDYVYLHELPELHPEALSSNGILRGDFGNSSVLSRGQPVSGEIMSRSFRRSN